MKTKNKQKIEDIIKDIKTYYVNSDITAKNFPIPDKIETENPIILKMDKTFSSEEALERIKAEGYRPANIYELAEYARSGKMEKGTWLIAFGSEWKDAGGYRRVPGVDASVYGDFGFDLGDFGDPWGGSGVLLCFRDSSLDTSALKKSEPSDTLEFETLTLETAIKFVKEAGYKIIKEF